MERPDKPSSPNPFAVERITMLRFDEPLGSATRLADMSRRCGTQMAQPTTAEAEIRALGAHRKLFASRLPDAARQPALEATLAFFR